MMSPEAQAQLSQWLARETGSDGVRLENIALLSGGAISQNIAVAATLYEDMPATVDDFERRLAADIEAGQFDKCRPKARRRFRCHQSHQCGTCRVTNPKLLATQ